MHLFFALAAAVASASTSSSTPSASSSANASNMAVQNNLVGKIAAINIIASNSLNFYYHILYLLLLLDEF